MGFKKPSLEVNNNIDKPGWFHCVVNRINEEPKDANGNAQDCLIFNVAVLGGNDDSQIKRTAVVRMNNPKETHKDGGEFAWKVQCRMARAVGAKAIITGADGKPVYCEIDDVPEGADMYIDWVGPHADDETQPHWTEGRQVVMSFVEEEYTNASGTKIKGIKLAGAHIYHVADDEVAHINKNVEALKLDGYEVRVPTTEQKATAEKPKPAAKANGKPRPAASAPQPVAAGAGVDVEGI